MLSVKNSFIRVYILASHCFIFTVEFVIDQHEITQSQVDNLVIDYVKEPNLVMSQSADFFPHQFQLRLNKSEINLSVNFERLPKNLHFHPVASADVYTLDDEENLIQFDLGDHGSNQQWEVYQEKNGNSLATLIKNNQSASSNDSEPFRLLGSIYDKQLNDYAFSIVPIYRDQPISKATKRGVKQANNDSLESYNHLLIPKASKISRHLLNFDYMKLDHEVLRKRRRKKRKTDTNPTSTRDPDFKNLTKPFKLFVETLVVTDHSVFEYQKTFASSKDMKIVFFNMKVYYVHFINEVNRRFQTTFQKDADLRITIKLTNFLFLTTEKTSNWTNSLTVGMPLMPDYKNRSVIVTHATLSAFKDFLNSIDITFSFDLAIGLFNKDLWSSTGDNFDDRASVVGFSYESGICSDYRFLIAEELGGFYYVPVVAHEIGHSLGAFHDGDDDDIGSKCNYYDNYIMTPRIGLYPNTSLNQFKFSNCSKAYFKRTLLTKDMDYVTSFAKCLLNVPVLSDKELNSTSFEYPGQIWNANSQCRMIYGNNASFCHYLSGQVCESLACRVNENERGCTFTYGNGAATGTICASGSVCLEGECLLEGTAPESDCIFGDDVVVNHQVIADDLPFVQMSCQSVLDYVKSLGRSPITYCIDPVFRKTCCHTCKKYDGFRKCVDTHPKCPDLKSLCESEALINKVSIKYVCPNTCRLCRDTYLDCANRTDFCKNGGACVNLTKNNEHFISFKCDCLSGFMGTFCELTNPCEPSPCKENERCIHHGKDSYYECLPKALHKSQPQSSWPSSSGAALFYLFTGKWLFVLFISSARLYVFIF